MPYLQKTWTDTIESPTQLDIQMAITEIQQMHGEHDAFWVETDEEEIVLEVQKDLRLTLIFCGEICRETRCTNWKQAEALYTLLLKGEYEKVKDNFECL